jgi:hypothetical protein
VLCHAYRCARLVALAHVGEHLEQLGVLQDDLVGVA